MRHLQKLRLQPLRVVVMDSFYEELDGRQNFESGVESRLVQIGLRLSMQSRKALSELQKAASIELGFKVSQSQAVSMAIMESLQKRKGFLSSSGDKNNN